MHGKGNTSLKRKLVSFETLFKGNGGTYYALDSSMSTGFLPQEEGTYRLRTSLILCETVSLSALIAERTNAMSSGDFTSSSQGPSPKGAKWPSSLAFSKTSSEFDIRYVTVEDCGELGNPRATSNLYKPHVDNKLGMSVLSMSGCQRCRRAGAVVRVGICFTRPLV